MTLIRWQPSQEMETIRRQMDQLFDGLANANRDERKIGWKPAVELEDTENSLLLRVELPGVEGKDLDVRVSRQAVAIKGEHLDNNQGEQKGSRRTEFRYGRFERVLNLPVAIHNDQLQAEFQNGILTLTMPKVKTAQNRVVKVNVAEPDTKLEGSETEDVWESDNSEPATV